MRRTGAACAGQRANRRLRLLGSLCRSASGSGLQVSILADTTYNPLNVDEVAAQHAQADCVVSVRLMQVVCSFCLLDCSAMSVSPWSLLDRQLLLCRFITAGHQ